MPVPEIGPKHHTDRLPFLDSGRLTRTSTLHLKPFEGVVQNVARDEADLRICWNSRTGEGALIQIYYGFDRFFGIACELRCRSATLSLLQCSHDVVTPVLDRDLLRRNKCFTSTRARAARQRSCVRSRLDCSESVIVLFLLYQLTRCYLDLD